MTRLIAAATAYNPSPQALTRVSLTALVCAVVACSASLYAIGALRAQQTATEHVAASAKRTAAVGCWRTLALGPYAVQDARDRNVYPPALQEWAEAAIPKKCPPIPRNVMPPAFTTP